MDASCLSAKVGIGTTRRAPASRLGSQARSAAAMKAITKMTSRVAGAAIRTKAKVVEPTIPSGMVKTGRAPTSCPTIASAASTPSIQPHGIAITTAPATISRGGMVMNCYACIAKPPDRAAQYARSPTIQRT